MSKLSIVQRMIDVENVQEYILHQLQTYINDKRHKPKADNIIRMANQIKQLEDALIIYREVLLPRAEGV